MRQCDSYLDFFICNSIALICWSWYQWHSCLKEGEEVNLQCEVSGNPLPSVVWTKQVYARDDWLDVWLYQSYWSDMSNMYFLQYINKSRFTIFRMELFQSQPTRLAPRIAAWPFPVSTEMTQVRPTLTFRDNVNVDANPRIVHLLCWQWSRSARHSLYQPHCRV